MANGLDINSIAEGFKERIQQKVGDFVLAETKAKAGIAARRTRVIRSHGHKYTYARYSNTGQLARNTRLSKKGEGLVVDAGTRANYSGTGYHGLYFLREKQGERDVKAILKKSEKYTSALKL